VGSRLEKKAANPTTEKLRKKIEKNHLAKKKIMKGIWILSFLLD